MNKVCSAVVIFSILLLGGSAQASISVNLKKTFNIWADSGGTVLPVGSLVHLVWSADDVYSAPTGGSIPSVGDQYAGGDYLLFSAATTATSGWSGDFDGSATYNNGNVGGANINLGYVYAFVFQDGVPQAGDWYARSAMITGLGDASLPTPPPPDSLDVSPSSVARMVVHPASGGYQVVPEPSTVGLLLVGIGLVAARRFRRG